MSPAGPRPPDVPENASLGTATAGPAAEPLLATHPARLRLRIRAVALLSMLVLYFFAYFQRAGIPGTIFDELQQEFQMSASAVTGLGAVFVYVYAWMQLIVGMAADRYGGARTLLFGSVFMCLGALTFPLTHSVSTLYLSRILLGFGSSFVYLSIVKEVDTLFAPRHFASLMGVVLMVSFAGSIASTLPFERAVHAYGWRTSLMGVGAMTVVGLAVAWWVLRGLSHSSPRRTGMPLRLLWDVARNPRSRPLLIIALINFPVVFVIQSILGKKFLQDATGLSSAGAATFVLLMASTCGVVGLCGGLALRLTGQRRKPVLASGAGAIFLSALLMLLGVATGASGQVFLVAYLLLALSTIALPAGVAAMKELNRPDAVAVAISVQNAAVYIGVGLLGNVAGVILDVFRSAARETESGIVYPPTAYATLFAVLAGLGLVSTLVTILFVPETRGQAIAVANAEESPT